jgi:hypothetical protein
MSSSIGSNAASLVVSASPRRPTDDSSASAKRAGKSHTIPYSSNIDFVPIMVGRWIVARRIPASDVVRYGKTGV